MHFVPILHKRWISKTNFYVFRYDKTSLKFCANFRFFLCSIHGEHPKYRCLWNTNAPFPNMTFDLDLWPTDLKINRDHLLIKDYLPTKFEASGAKPSWVISCTRLRATDIPTDIPTYRPTDIPTDMCNAICPSFFKGGHKNTLFELCEKRNSNINNTSHSIRSWYSCIRGQNTFLTGCLKRRASAVEDNGKVECI